MTTSWYRTSRDEAASRVLSEPNTVSDWGKERLVSSRGCIEAWAGQFGTRRYLRHDSKGKVISALLIGRMTTRDPWKILLVHTDPDHRMQGLAESLYRMAVGDVGQLAEADEYSTAGSAFMEHVRKSE